MLTCRLGLSFCCYPSLFQFLIITYSVKYLIQSIQIIYFNWRWDNGFRQMRDTYDWTIIVFFLIDDLITYNIASHSRKRNPKLNLIVNHNIFTSSNFITVLSFKVTIHIIKTKLFMNESKRNDLFRLLF